MIFNSPYWLDNKTIVVLDTSVNYVVIYICMSLNLDSLVMWNRI